MTKAIVNKEVGLTVPSHLADFYKNNASVGTENLSAVLPQLKVTESNSKNVDENGNRTKAGTFYYSPTKQSFEELRVSIMTISRGFYAMDNGETPKPKFTQLVGGMLLDSMQPFVMFVSGTRLQNMWNFGKEIKPYTRNKQMPVPMFGFEVNLTLKETETNFGINHVVVYSLARKEDQIQVIADEDAVNMIRGNVDSLEDMFESFIDQKEVDKVTGRLVKDEVIQVDAQTEEVPTEEQLDSAAEEDEVEIPF